MCALKKEIDNNWVYQIVVNRFRKKVGPFHIVFMKVTMDIEMCTEEIYQTQKWH